MNQMTCINIPMSDEQLQVFEHHKKVCVSTFVPLGLSLALLSGCLFTANSFVINQYDINVGDLLLVRTILQLLIYSSISLYR